MSSCPRPAGDAVGEAQQVSTRAKRITKEQKATILKAYIDGGNSLSEECRIQLVDQLGIKPTQLAYWLKQQEKVKQVQEQVCAGAQRAIAEDGTHEIEESEAMVDSSLSRGPASGWQKVVTTFVFCLLPGCFLEFIDQPWCLMYIPSLAPPRYVAELREESNHAQMQQVFQQSVDALASQEDSEDCARTIERRMQAVVQCRAALRQLSTADSNFIAAVNTGLSVCESSGYQDYTLISVWIINLLVPMNALAAMLHGKKGGHFNCLALAQQWPVTAAMRLLRQTVQQELPGSIKSIIGLQELLIASALRPFFVVIQHTPSAVVKDLDVAEYNVVYYIGGWSIAKLLHRYCSVLKARPQDRVDLLDMVKTQSDDPTIQTYARLTREREKKAGALKYPKLPFFWWFVKLEHLARRHLGDLSRVHTDSFNHAKQEALMDGSRLYAQFRSALSACDRFLHGNENFNAARRAVYEDLVERFFHMRQKAFLREFSDKFNSKEIQDALRTCVKLSKGKSGLELSDDLVKTRSPGDVHAVLKIAVDDPKAADLLKKLTVPVLKALITAYGASITGGASKAKKEGLVAQLRSLVTTKQGFTSGWPWTQPAAAVAVAAAAGAPVAAASVGAGAAATEIGAAAGTAAAGTAAVGTAAAGTGEETREVTGAAAGAVAAGSEGDGIELLGAEPSMDSYCTDDEEELIEVCFKSIKQTAAAAGDIGGNSDYSDEYEELEEAQAAAQQHFSSECPSENSDDWEVASIAGPAGLAGEEGEVAMEMSPAPKLTTARAAQTSPENLDMPDERTKPASGDASKKPKRLFQQHL